MSSVQVTVVDYGVGNVLSVCRALEMLGCKVGLESSPRRCAEAERLVLPGVGAFGDCVAKIGRLGLDEAIKAFSNHERPILGICVGMQMLFDYSEEFGHHDGLGVLHGYVSAMSTVEREGEFPLRVPHIGWTPLLAGEGYERHEIPLIRDDLLGQDVYFTHSYSVHPANTEDRLADYQRGSERICAAVQHNHLMGTQFHPEKSAKVGLAILERFVTF